MSGCFFVDPKTVSYLVAVSWSKLLAFFIFFPLKMMAYDDIGVLSCLGRTLDLESEL